MSKADPLKPYPGGYKLSIEWTPERLEWWAEARLLGVQYYAKGTVFCPKREDQWRNNE